WAIFLRNHDELTLEMVSEEERDYMYRVYAHDPQMRVNAGIRRRLAPLLGNDRRKIELLNGLLLALPGTPVIYYGDEIGMGDNVYLGDRDSVRTPMQWSPDRNAGFSTANPQKLYLPAIIDPEFHYEMVNVEVQQAHENSLYRWMRQVLHVRSRHPEFGRGTLRMLLPDNPRIVAFVRSHEDAHVLVVANLSGSAQYAELDLADHAGARPVELFGRTEFPPVGELPYLVTLGPYAFHWFSLSRQETDAPVQGAATGGPVPVVDVDGPWTSVFEGKARRALEALLPAQLVQRRWFPAKDRAIASVRVADTVPLTARTAAVPSFLVLVQVRFREGEPATFAVPLAIVGGERADALRSDLSLGVVAELHRDGERRVLSEALWEPQAAHALLDRCRSRRPRPGGSGALLGSPTPALRARAEALADQEPTVLRGEQSNTSVVFGDQAILKVFRRLEPGVNPDLEVSRFLNDRGFEHVPPLLGAVEYQADRREPTTIGILQGYVPNEGDLWQHTIDALGRFYREAFDETPPAEPVGHPLDRVLASDDGGDAVADLPDVAVVSTGAHLEVCDLLGLRTAQLHRALASPGDDPAFGDEDLSLLDQRSLHQSMRSAAARTLATLRRRLDDLPAEVGAPAAALLEREGALLDRYKPLRVSRLGGRRIRTHGDLHLGQVLFTGRDVVFLDFEGEPLQSITERRLRRSPLRDVAGMLRSFHYATLVALRREEERGLLASGSEAAWRAGAWARSWYGWAASRFLGAYLREAGDAGFLPADPAALRTLLDAFVLEKAVYELSYELANRPDWSWIPLSGLLDTLAAGEGP
ncbi:MAG: putative maltokinase, partial [Acidimicrobiales bacterium]|nr:putative maltokinase [Acidimicrobiales bacterium]